jgi:putative peptidoglycan lipid II flippase
VKFLTASLVVSFFLLLGRLSGFLRDWYLGWRYGAGLETDLAIVVLTVPDLVVNVVLGGGVAAAFVPEFRRLPPDRATGLLVQAVGAVLVALALIALGVAVFSRDLMGVLAPGLPAEAIENGRWYFATAVIAIPLTAASGVVAAWLDAHDKFQFSASGTAVFNLFVIGGMVFLAGHGLLYAITIGVLAGALVRLGFQASAAVRSVTARPTFATINYGSIIRRFGSAFLFTSALALLPAIARAMATQHDIGAMSIFSYAAKIIDLPMALAVSAISVVLLPRLASEFQRENGVAAKSAALALRAVTLICLGLAIPAAFFPDSVFRVIFPSGVFTVEQRALMSAVFVVGIVFLPARGIMAVCVPILAAVGLTRHLAFGAIILLVLFLVSALVAAPAGLVGLMLAMSFAMLAAAAYMSIIVIVALGREIPDIWFASPLRSYVLPTAASLLICYMGHIISTSIAIDVIFGLISFAVFAAIAFCFDRNRWFPREAKA